MGKKSSGSETDLLAQAMRKVFREAVEDASPSAASKRENANREVVEQEDAPNG